MKRAMNIMTVVVCGIFLLLVAPTAAQNLCDTVSCENGGECVPGPNSDIDKFPVSFDMGPDDDYHCECFGQSTTYTGRTCQIPVEPCGLDASGNRHYCFYGGSCEFDGDGVVRHVCNCRNAVDSDGSRYTGKYCEHKLVEESDECRAADFCMNGGQCQLGSNNQGECACTADFMGQRCQFHKDSVDDCNLDCGAHGTCEHGYRQPTNAEDQLGLADVMPAGVVGQHCVCEEDYHGIYCNQKVVQCGTQATLAGGDFKNLAGAEQRPHFCFHGSTCVTWTDSNGATEHNCNCTSAQDLTGHAYAGLGCQFRQSAYCEDSRSQNSHSFCVNGGTCKSFGDDAIHEGCSCPPGWKGHHCELPDDLDTSEYNKCELQCLNGGRCRKGSKNHGVMINSIMPEVGHMFNSTVAVAQQEFEHCECPLGFTGVFCGIKVDVCGDGGLVCFHGANCVKKDGEYECDCQSTSTYSSSAPASPNDSVARFAGKFCHHEITMQCHTSPDVQRYGSAYCVNQGTCELHDKKWRCVCPTGWQGDHCDVSTSSELPDDDTDDLFGRDENSQPVLDHKAVISISVLIPLAVIIFCCVMNVTVWRRDPVPAFLKKDKTEDVQDPLSVSDPLVAPTGPPPAAFSDLVPDVVSQDVASAAFSEQSTESSEASTPLEKTDAELI